MSGWQGDGPLVSICCATYNHERYIEDALQGFLIQRTGFPFEILVHDDASTDRTSGILREYEARYPKLVRTIHQTENQYSKGRTKINFEFNFPRAKGEFIAICEGDDFWTDPMKLQTQVDYLKAHPAYSVCAHWSEIVDRDGRGSTPARYMGARFPVDFSIRHVLANTGIHANSYLFRRSCLQGHTPQDPGFEKFRKAPGGDDPLMWMLLSCGRGHCMPVSMSKYRVHEGGVWNSMSAPCRQLGRLQIRMMAPVFIGFRYWPRLVWIILDDAAKLVCVTASTCIHLRNLQPVREVILSNRRQGAVSDTALFLVCVLSAPLLALCLWRSARSFASRALAASRGRKNGA